MSNFSIPESCIHRELGYVLLDHESKEALRYVNRQSSSLISSQPYLDKVGDFWPNATPASPADYGLREIPDLDLYKVDYINNVFYWPEMSFLDIKLCTIKLLDICEYLLSHGFSLESHLWNMFLNNGSPQLIDIGDFKNKPNISYTVNTVLSILNPNSSQAHCPIHPTQWISNYRDIYQSVINLKSLPQDQIIKELRAIINSIKITEHDHYWDDYPTQNNIPLTLKDIQPYASNHRPELCSVIAEMPPSSLIDIGCSKGLYSFYASSLGHSTTGIDYSHNIIHEANQNAIKLKSNSSFAFIDLINFHSYGNNGAYGDFLSRFNSDGLIAPAVIHHVNGRGTELSDIIKQWCSITNKWMMVEYIEKDTLGNSIDLDNFINMFKSNKFENIKILNSTPEPRKWIFAQK